MLLTPEVARVLTERLTRISSVCQFDQPGEPQAATIAHSLSDLEQSFRTTLDTLLPKLLDESLTPEQLNDVLLEIGEELRHVLYHVRDPKFFGYLFADGGDA
jgi:SUMO ligase MMS21 Smc5/6 complex component